MPIYLSNISCPLFKNLYAPLTLPFLSVIPVLRPSEPYMSYIPFLVGSERTSYASANFWKCNSYTSFFSGGAFAGWYLRDKLRYASEISSWEHVRSISNIS